MIAFMQKGTKSTVISPESSGQTPFGGQVLPPGHLVPGCVPLAGLQSGGTVSVGHIPELHTGSSRFRFRYYRGGATSIKCVS
jgi:hypothetical protein